MSAPAAPASGEAGGGEYEDGLSPLPHLLFVFFAAIDPETPNRQGTGRGQPVPDRRILDGPGGRGHHPPIAALEAAAVPFFAVELEGPGMFSIQRKNYHQRYLEKAPTGYCHVAPETGRPAGVSLFHKDLYPSRKELLQTGKKPEKCLSDGRGNLFSTG